MRHSGIRVIPGLRASRSGFIRSSLSSFSSQPSPLSYSSRLSSKHPTSLLSQQHTYHSSSSFTGLRQAGVTTTTLFSIKRRQPHSPYPPHHHQSRRYFSVATALTTALDTAVTASQSTLHLLHDFGTPWYLAIPLFAGCVSLITRVPTTIYTRRIAQRRNLLFPILRAWNVRQRRLSLDEKHQSPASRGMSWPAHQIHLNMKALEKRWGTQSWKEYVPALAVFPVWMVGIEGVRRLCGGPRGWIGTLLFGAGSSEGTEALANGAAAMGDGLAAMTPYMADPSLMTGGCLWFTNLAAADPYHILPFALSAILVANMAPRNKIAWRVLLTGEPSPGALPGTVPVQWRLRLQRSLLLVALAVGPMTMDLPAALHLYWLASATISYVSTTVIWRTMPLPKILPPATNERDIAMPKRDPARKH